MGSDIRIPRSSEPVAVDDDLAAVESSHSNSLLVTPGGIVLSDSEKSEELADNLEALFQPVTDPPVPAFNEMVDVALRSYFINPASEPQFTSPDEVHATIKGLKFSKAPGPNGILDRVLRHLPKRTVSFFAHAFNAVLRTHHFPQA